MKAPTDDQSLALSESLGPAKTEAFFFPARHICFPRYVIGPPCRPFDGQVATNP